METRQLITGITPLAKLVPLTETSMTISMQMPSLGALTLVLTSNVTQIVGVHTDGRKIHNVHGAFIERAILLAQSTLLLVA